MRWSASLFVLLALSLFATPMHPQLGAPLTRCGPRPADPSWPQNQPPPETGPPEIPTRHAVDMIRLQRDARELAALSDSLPADLQQVNQGILPKALIQKLKRIEKLSRQLRSELARQQVPAATAGSEAIHKYTQGSKRDRCAARRPAALGAAAAFWPAYFSPQPSGANRVCSSISAGGSAPRAFSLGKQSPVCFAVGSGS
jgi:hypothetical protein